MNPHKVSVLQLFTMQCRYLAPIYQRQYVWNRQDQWAPLWEDVLTKAREQLDTRPGRPLPRTHFMGAVVLKALRPDGIEHQSYDVIDGQQRLTTRQVVLTALRDYAATRPVPDPATATFLQQMTQNPPLVQREYEQWKVVPTTADRPAFGSIWDAGSLTEVDNRNPQVKSRPRARSFDPRPALVEAYAYFSEQMCRFVESQADFEDEAAELPTLGEQARRLTALRTAVTQQLELVRIDLDQDDDPQVIFATLNARGAPLLPG